MGYKMKGSPVKLGSIQGTSGHKSALQFNAAAMTALQTAGKAVVKTVSKGAKNLAKNVKNLVGKGTGIKTSTPKEINVKGAGTGPQHTGFATSKTPPTPKGHDVKTIKTKGPNQTATTEKPSSSMSKGKTGTEEIPMSQQVRQQERLDRVSARRRSKGKGKSTREVMLEKKVAMTPDERLRWNQAQTKKYADLGMAAASIAFGGHGGGYSSGGADFSKTLPSQAETQRRSLGAGFETKNPTTTAGTEYTIKGQENKEQKELSDKDKYLYS